IDSYIRVGLRPGRSESFPYDALTKLFITQDKATQISASDEKSSVAKMTGTDLEWLREVCGTVLELYSLREAAEKYTDKIMGEVAPNMTSVLGAVLSAKLISMAGGLENIAKMPSSNSQVLGAEKVRIRTLKHAAS